MGSRLAPSLARDGPKMAHDAPWAPGSTPGRGGGERRGGVVARPAQKGAASAPGACLFQIQHSESGKTDPIHWSFQLTLGQSLSPKDRQPTRCDRTFPPLGRHLQK